MKSPPKIPWCLPGRLAFLPVLGKVVYDSRDESGDMMKAVRASMLPLLMLAGACSSAPGEVRNEPVRFSMTVPAAWDSAGACISAFYTTGYQSAYLPAANERRAEIVVREAAAAPLSQAGTVLYVLEVTGGGQTTVTYRERPGLGNGSERQARETVARCGRLTP